MSLACCEDKEAFHPPCRLWSFMFVKVRIPFLKTSTLMLSFNSASHECRHSIASGAHSILNESHTHQHPPALFSFPQSSPNVERTMKAASDPFQVGHSRSGALQMHRFDVLQRSTRWIQRSVYCDRPLNQRFPSCSWIICADYLFTFF